ncbi:MAG: hypothetical protein ACP5KN_07335 [Armatimonadota bacterium]
MNRLGGVVLCVVILVGLTVIFLSDVAPLRGVGEATIPFREMLWSNRALDLIGQMLAILSGTFGVLVLTKERIER